MRRQKERSSAEATAQSCPRLRGGLWLGMKPTKLKEEIHVVLKWLIKGSNSNRKINKAHDAE